MRHRGRFRRGPADPAHRPEPIAGDLASDETQIRLIAVCGTDRLRGIICLRADLGVGAERDPNAGAGRDRRSEASSDASHRSTGGRDDFYSGLAARPGFPPDPWGMEQRL